MLDVSSYMSGDVPVDDAYSAAFARARKCRGMRRSDALRSGGEALLEADQELPARVRELTGPPYVIKSESSSSDMVVERTEPGEVGMSSGCAYGAKRLPEVARALRRAAPSDGELNLSEAAERTSLL